MDISGPAAAVQKMPFRFTVEVVHKSLSTLNPADKILQSGSSE